MEKNKVSKSALKSLLNDSLREAIGHLELPKPTKKVEKLLNKSSKRLAAAFASILKKENRRAKKADKTLTYVDEVLAGKKNKKNKALKLHQAETV
jgi:hypothetical protein